MVETQLCKLRGTSDTFVGRAILPQCCCCCCSILVRHGKKIALFLQPIRPTRLMNPTRTVLSTKRQNEAVRALQHLRVPLTSWSTFPPRTSPMLPVAAAVEVACSDCCTVMPFVAAPPVPRRLKATSAFTTFLPVLLLLLITTVLALSLIHI